MYTIICYKIDIKLIMFGIYEIEYYIDYHTRHYDTVVVKKKEDLRIRVRYTNLITAYRNKPAGEC